MGRKQCCVCLEPASKPVRLPCTCQSIMCLDCFRRFMDEFSNCLICREKIVSRLRRLCAGRDYECLVDQALANEPLTRETPSPVAKQPRIQEPEPGELQRELARINAQFERERLEEERASLALIDDLKARGDADVVALERLKADEELARRLQASEARGDAPTAQSEKALDVRLQGGATVTISIREALLRMPIGPNGEREDSKHVVHNEEEEVVYLDTLKSSSSYGSDQHVCDEAVSLAGSSQGESGREDMRNSVVGRKRVWGADHQSARPNDKTKDRSSIQENTPRSKTWTCSACTYAETSASWLHCDMCGTSKHPSATTQSSQE